MSEGDKIDLVLTKIDGLRELVEARHNHLDHRLDIVEKEVIRNKDSINQLYDRDREQEKLVNEAKETHLTCYANVNKKIDEVVAKPAVDFQKNMKGLLWKIITAAVLTVAGSTFLPKLVGLFK